MRAVAAGDMRIAIVGGGKMGEAILGGWLAASDGPAAALHARNFVVANPGESRRAYLQGRYGVECVVDACDIDRADMAVLAVKPQVMMGVLEKMARCSTYAGAHGGPLFVSIAAGLSTMRLEAALAPGSRVVRCMPNTPLLVGSGVTAVAGGTAATKADVALVRDLFACLGMACIVEEDDVDAVGALSGSGPAYVAAFIEALRDAGVAQGLDAPLAESLAFETVRGTVDLMTRTGQDVKTTREAVCSPGGSTLAALAAMDEAGFASAVDAGMVAAVRRSKELGQC